jgi:hypothetical protein
MNKSKRNPTKVRQSNNNNNNSLTPRILRPITSTVRCTKRFRFYARATASKLDLKDQDIFFLLGVAISSSTTAPIFGSVRLREIEMISCNPNPNAVDYLAVEFKGNNPAYGNNSVVKSSNSVSTFQYAHVKTAPPPDSYAAAWLYPSGYNLCQLTFDQGSIVDVTIEFTLLDDTPDFTDPAVSSGLTVGYLYCHSLCWTNGPGVLLPQGWNYSI